MEEKESLIWYFTYPAEGQQKTFSKGIVEVDVKQGIVRLPDTVGKLSDNLDNIGVEYAKAIYIFVTKDCKMQFHKLGWFPIRGNIPLFINHIQFNLFRIDFAEESKANFIVFVNEDVVFTHE